MLQPEAAWAIDVGANSHINTTVAVIDENHRSKTHFLHWDIEGTEKNEIDTEILRLFFLVEFIIIFDASSFFYCTTFQLLKFPSCLFLYTVKVNL